MYKILLLPAVMLLLSGCISGPKVAHKSAKVQEKQEVVKVDKKVETKVVKKKMTTKHKMFQTVDKKYTKLFQEGENRASCVKCGMNLPMFYKTNYIATENGKIKQYCSLHCLTEDLNSGAEVENPKVIDVTTLKFIPVLEAYYVVGSRVHGTMSPISKYAFSSLKAAKEFQKKYGGEIMDFRGALEKAKEDFK